MRFCFIPLLATYFIQHIRGYLRNFFLSSSFEVKYLTGGRNQFLFGSMRTSNCRLDMESMAHLLIQISMYQKFWALQAPPSSSCRGLIAFSLPLGALGAPWLVKLWVKIILGVLRLKPYFSIYLFLLQDKLILIFLVNIFEILKIQVIFMLILLG